MNSEITAANMLRQQSTRSNVSMASDIADSDDDMDDYYDYDEDFDEGGHIDDSGVICDTSANMLKDPECFDYKLMDVPSVKKMFQESTEAVRTACDVSFGHAQMMLERDNWNVENVVKALKRNNSHLIHNNNDSDFECVKKKRKVGNQTGDCMVCFVSVDQLKSLECGHGFCSDCWVHHIETQIQSGVFGKIQCMDADCNYLVPENFVLGTITNCDLKLKYQEFVFRERIVNHPGMKFCPGIDCNRVVQAPNPMARRVNCDKCNSCFCFTCGQDYHAPMGCQDIKKWLQKCEDDSETANYIAANTKDCPKCNVCIEKNGGCNHMQCFKCRHDFCWVCLNSWSAHDSYYECSKYKDEGDATSARSALEKYLFYFQRWENHSKSLRLEEETRSKIQAHIEEKVMKSEGTWIDWQYLLDACSLLNRCRYTLKYTYPYAYFLDAGSNKDCFEHIQAQLEMEVENLSWKVERAQITDRGDLERQMDVAEKRRLTLLHDFLQN